MNLKREVWEGWTVQAFIDELEYLVDIVMQGRSITTKFQTKIELKSWLKDNQPYYKKDIPEVIEYFSKKHNLN